MSTVSPQQQAATDAARYQADLSSQLSGIALPGIEDFIKSITQQLGKGGMPSDVSAVFDQARAQNNESFDTALKSNDAVMRQQALQSGGIFTTGQINSGIGQAALGLNNQRQMAERKLNMDEAHAGMTQYNTLLQMLGQSSGAAMNMGKGFSGNMLGAISGMSNQSQFGATMGGAASGAGLGGSIGGGYGAIAGALAGGAAGYFGSGG